MAKSPPAKRIYALSRHGEFARDFGLSNQIQRASVSVMWNIAEGFGRGGDAEFSRFLKIAKGSAGEVKSQLYAAYDQDYLNEISFNEAIADAEETSRKIGSLITYLKTAISRKSGRKARVSCIDAGPATRDW